MHSTTKINTGVWRSIIQIYSHNRIQSTDVLHITRIGLRAFVGRGICIAAKDCSSMELEIKKATGKFLKYILAPSKQECLLCSPRHVFQLLLRAVWWCRWVLKRENLQDHLSSSEAEMSLKTGHLQEHIGNFSDPSQNVYYVSQAPTYWIAFRYPVLPFGTEIFSALLLIFIYSEASFWRNLNFIFYFLSYWGK